MMQYVCSLPKKNCWEIFEGAILSMEIGFLRMDESGSAYNKSREKWRKLYCSLKSRDTRSSKPGHEALR
jgi:hypothetical protein